MTIAIMGGTFNPIHYGHLFLAEEVRCGLGFDNIVFVPAFAPAHKQVAGDTGPRDRLCMCERALKGFRAFIADPCEIKRGGTSYMIDTLEDVEKRYRPDDKVAIIIGDDLIASFPQWRNAPELARRARIIVVHRLFQQRIEAPFPHEYFENKMIQLSSSEIRERIRLGLPVRFLIPESVHEYIGTKRLYRK